MSTYSTEISGSLILRTDLNEDAIAKIKTFVENNFKNVASFNTQELIVYFNGSIDNSNELIEKFVSRLYPLIDTSKENIIKAQGDDIKDHWDLVVEEDGVYIQEYKYIKDTKRKFIE
jgi:hypothetical protein